MSLRHEQTKYNQGPIPQLLAVKNTSNLKVKVCYLENKRRELQSTAGNLCLKPFQPAKPSLNLSPYQDPVIAHLLDLLFETLLQVLVTPDQLVKNLFMSQREETACEHYLLVTCASFLKRIH